MFLVRFFIISFMFSGHAIFASSTIIKPIPIYPCILHKAKFLLNENIENYYNTLESIFLNFKPKSNNKDEVVVFNAILKYVSHEIVKSNPLLFFDQTNNNVMTFNQTFYIDNVDLYAKKNKTLHDECYETIVSIGKKHHLDIKNKRNLLQQSMEKKINVIKSHLLEHQAIERKINLLHHTKNLQILLFKKIKDGEDSKFLTSLQVEILKKTINNKINFANTIIRQAF